LPSQVRVEVCLGDAQERAYAGPWQLAALDQAVDRLPVHADALRRLRGRELPRGLL